MRRNVKAIILFAVLIACMVAFSGVASAKDLLIREVITLSAGENQQRNFDVDDFIDIMVGGNIEGYLVVATGAAGTLTVDLEADPEISDKETVLDYALVGLGFSLAGTPIFFYESVSTPYSISVDAAIEADFGFLWVGAIMTGVSGNGNFRDVETPVPFTITFSLGEQETAAE